MPKKKKRRSLNAPIKATLRSILEDYPGGQLLSEALQNAEDSGSGSFALMLDLRQHGAAVDERLAGPAFVLVDDGGGLGERELTSLCNLQDSAKRDSPTEIGRYGMGSRSFFHYSDITTLVSRGAYVGLDPLFTVKSHGRDVEGDGGWEVPMDPDECDSPEDKAVSAVSAEAGETFTVFPKMCGSFDPNSSGPGCGAMFRLPLRRAHEVEKDGLGPEISLARADQMLRDWAGSLLDSRLLLFLSSVREIKLWRWEDKAEAPTLVAQVCKRYTEETEPIPRLPEVLPGDALDTFEGLGNHLDGLSPDERDDISQIQHATVTIAVTDADALTTTTTWLIAQRFDAVTTGLCERIDECGAVPVVGVAFQLDEPGADEDEAQAAARAQRARLERLEAAAGGPTKFSGSVFCFLPVGDMRTGLPVHLNASFQVAKNRRSLWLKDAQNSNLDGKHLKYAEWNHILMTKSLPRLWEWMLGFITKLGGVAAAAAKDMKFLPDLSCCEPHWKPCAVALYKQVFVSKIVPHGRTLSDLPAWVAPFQAHTFDPATPALTAQFKLMHELYCGLETFTTDGREAHVVDIPLHVQEGMQEYSGLQILTVETFLQELFEQHWEAAADKIYRFAPVLLALAERIGGMKDLLKIGALRTWKDLLDGDECYWVPLAKKGLGFPLLQGRGDYALTSEAFLPDLSHLDSSKFSVVEESTADLTCPDAIDLDAIRSTVGYWGLKQHMSWDDVVKQANAIDDATSGFQLLEYLGEHHYSVLKRSLSPEEALEELKYIEFVLAANSVHDPKSFLSKRDVPAPTQSDQLYAPSELLAASARSSVWAAHKTYFQPDGKDNRFLTDKKLCMPPQAEHYVDQLEVLAESGGTVEFVAHHMLVAFKQLAPLLESMEKIDQDDTMAQLEDLAWVPSADFQGRITQLQEPERVSIDWIGGSLSPAFGKLPQDWRSTTMLSYSGSLQACTGIRTYLSVSVLLSELATMAKTQQSLDESQLELAANLCRELAHRCGQDSDTLIDADQECFVPTTEGTLQNAAKVYLNDAPWHAPHGSAGQKVYLLHGSVDHNTGLTLGCTSVREELARRCEVEDDTDSDDEGEFGQQEKLSDRIRSLLSGYSDRFDVFTEHWQNSDDAGAESLLFVLDQTSYPTDSLVDQRDGCRALQGPALLLASSKALSDKDVMRIQQVGNSQKRLKFESAGRFGVGINCLYSITNCPTFLANDALHVMDPLHCAVTEEPAEGKREKNGRKFSTERLRKDLPDMLKPFESKNLIGFPTIFRLTLGEGYSNGLGRFALQATEMEKRLREFAEQAQELLVFSKHVRSVKFMVGDALIAEVNCEEKSSKAQQFMQSLPSTIEQVRQSQHTPKDSVSDIKITTCEPGLTPQTSHWVVSHYVHADSTLIKLVESEYKTGLALLPHGAAALRLDAPDDYLGHLCCFMPLAELLVGPPCLLHGCFSLAEDRKSIHLSDEPSSSAGRRWNHALLGGPVASSLALLIDYCRKFVGAEKLGLTRWFSLMELEDSKNAASGNNLSTSSVRVVLRQKLLQRLLEHHEVFCCVEFDDDDGAIISTLEWLKHTDARRLVLGATTVDAALSKCVQNQLIRTGLKLVYLPEQLRQQFIDAATEKLKPSTLTPGILCDYLRSDELDFKLEDKDMILQLLTFIVPPTTNSEPCIDLLRGVPLLLLANGSCAKFGEPCIWDYHELLPDKQEQFLHGDVRAILSRSSKSPAAVQQAAAVLSIAHMTPQVLLPFETFVHEKKYNTDEEWIGVFYQLMHTEFSADTATFCKLFADWSVIKVTPAASHNNRMEVDFVCLRDRSAVFSLHEIDIAWQQKLGGVLLRCGLHVLKADQIKDSNRMQMIQQLVGQNDDDLLDALINIIGGLQRRLLGPETTVDLLRYFGSRIIPGVQKLSESQLSKIRKLPLFGTLGSTSSSCGYTALSDTKFTYVCLPSGESTKCKWAGELMQLHVPNMPMQFLAWPKEGCDDLYKALGVEVLNSLEFIVQFVCPALPDAARQGERALDPLLMVLAKRIEFEQDHEVVVKAAKQERFVQNEATGDYAAPDALLDPEHRMAVEFVDTVGNWLPHRQLHKHADLLRLLGMKRSVPLDCLEHCAAFIDGVGTDGYSPDDRVKRQSYCLIDETCRQLSDSFIRPAVSQRLLGNGEAQLELRLIKVLTAHRIAVVHDSNSDSLKLAKFHHLLLTAECTTCAETQFETLMHEAGRPTGKCLKQLSSLQHLVQYYPDIVWTKLTCFCDPMQLDLEVLLMQLGHQANQVEKDNVFELREGDTRVLSLETLLGVVEKKLDPSNLSVTEQLLLDELRSQPCLPLHVNSDAAGDLSAKKVRLVRPDRTFIRLADGASDESKIPFAEHPALLTTYPQVARALNVAEKPGADDWARCTTIIADRTQGTNTDPNEISAVFFALTTFLKLAESQPKAKQYEICFADRENDICSLLPGSRLVWRDSSRLARRCTNLQKRVDLHFMREHFKESGYKKFTSAEFEQLCKLTAVRRLSDVVRVARDEQETSLTDPSKEEYCLAQLLRSVEFEDGYCACLRSKYPRFEDEGKFNAAKTAVRQCLSSLKLNWVNPLVTCIQDDSSRDLEDSTANEFAFVDVDGTLWLRAGVLGTEEIDTDHHDKRLAAESLLEVLSWDVLGKVMRSSNAPELHDSRLVMDLLKCWRRGPASIVAMLSSHDIEIAQSDECDSYHPGTIVSLTLTGLLQQSADCTFAIHDIVAVSCGTAEGIIQYKYAKVLPSKDLAQEGTGLSRKYRLNEGGNDRSVVRKHYEIFKFDRSPHASTSTGSGAVVVSTVDKPATPDLGDEDGSEWQNLVKQLREMEDFAFEDYKKMMRRLFKQWHPDKCSRPHAAVFFDVLRRHSSSYEGDRDFSWLDDTVDAEEALGAVAAGPSAASPGGTGSRSHDFPEWDGPDPNALFAEFEREQKHSDGLRQEAEAAKAAWNDSPARAAKVSNRERNERLSDYYWQGAENQRRVAGILAVAKEWKDAVWNAQQVVELTVKALMLRTCGITNEELRGKGAHDLNSLMGNICNDHDMWPVTLEDLGHLSGAYLKARYPTSEPTDERYDDDDASRALHTADQVLVWARAMDYLPPPVGWGGDGDEELPTKEEEQPTVMDPAPTPPGPAVPLAIGAPSPAAIAEAPVPALPAPPPAPLPLWHEAPRALGPRPAAAIEDIAVEEVDDDDGGWGVMSM
jgi:HEPN domain-containing protein